MTNIIQRVLYKSYIVVTKIIDVTSSWYWELTISLWQSQCQSETFKKQKVHIKISNYYSFQWDKTDLHFCVDASYQQQIISV